MKNNYLGQAWLVLSLALCFGAALAGIEASLSEKIQANKLNETIEQIPLLVRGATTGEQQIIDGRVVYRATDGDGRQAGWVVPATGPGFADNIEILIGLDRRAETIVGLYVLAQKETPGLGNKIVEAAWLHQYAGQKTDTSITVKKTEPVGKGEILAVTGATISSQSVTKIVNDTLVELRDKLAAAAE